MICHWVTPRCHSWDPDLLESVQKTVTVSREDEDSQKQAQQRHHFSTAGFLYDRPLKFEASPSSCAHYARRFCWGRTWCICGEKQKCGRRDVQRRGAAAGFCSSGGTRVESSYPGTHHRCSWVPGKIWFTSAWSPRLWKFAAARRKRRHRLHAGKLKSYPAVNGRLHLCFLYGGGCLAPCPVHEFRQYKY